MCDTGVPWVSERDPELVSLLRASTERARELIEGVLACARAGELEIERVALGAVMAEVVDDLRPRLVEAGATVELGALPEIDGDARQLRRLFQNLVGNAVKFRGPAPPRVEVTAREDAQEWVLTVRDNGIGVDPEQAVRVFGMFARAGRDREGSGIGLAVCRRVVEAHGGRIWVEAAEGKQRHLVHAAPPRIAPGGALELMERQDGLRTGLRCS